MDEPVVRRPGVEDAAAMGALHVRAWQAAYRGVMPDEYLDALDPVARTEMWRGVIAEDATRLLVAEVDGVVVGFAAFGPESVDEEHPPPNEAQRGELYAINLDPDAWGRGTGRALLRAATAQLRDRPFDAAVLWVVPENERAIALYRSEGWEADGVARAEDVLGVSVGEMRMRRVFG
jgi:ribosomal protein S18 acetylase RimI-like enzyme